MKTIAVLAITAALSLAAAEASAQDAGKPQSGTYSLEPTHAVVMFGVNHFGFSTYYGQFPGATGELKLDAAHPAASQLDVSVPVAGVLTASPKLTDELKSHEWLDAAAFPAMTFHSTSITPTGADTADITGDLTLHGVTHPVTLKATFKHSGVFALTKKYMAGFDATGVVKRSEFGVSNYVQYGLADDVQLTISAPFELKAP